MLSIKMALVIVVPPFKSRDFGFLGLKYTVEVLHKCYLNIHSLMCSTQCKGHTLDFFCLLEPSKCDL